MKSLEEIKENGTTYNRMGLTKEKKIKKSILINCVYGSVLANGN